MEPVLIICYLLTYSVGYFIGTDLYNHYKLREDFRDIRNELCDIKECLVSIKNK